MVIVGKGLNERLGLLLAVGGEKDEELAGDELMRGLM